MIFNMSHLKKKKGIFSLFQEMHFGLLGLMEKKEGGTKQHSSNRTPHGRGSLGCSHHAAIKRLNEQYCWEEREEITHEGQLPLRALENSSLRK